MADDILAFTTPPFSTEGSAKYLYLDAPRRRILADLIAHVCDGDGPILLVAEPGMGKSMLLDRLAEEAKAHGIRVVFSLPDVAAIASASETDPQATAFLLDDGNALPIGVWHQLIALMRRASPSAAVGVAPKRLPPIVIALTPDLLNWLFEASLVPRSTPLERIFRVPPFAPRDVARFISLRLRVAGVDRPEVFTPDSIERIAQFTEGVPARINRLCEAALAEAARRGRSEVSADIVEAAAAVVELEMPRPAIAAPILQPSLRPEFSAETTAAPGPAGHADVGPTIGIVGSGYAPGGDPQMMRRRVRRRKMPPWGGIAVAVGAAAVAAVAMLGYIGGPNVSRPSPTPPAATSGDAAAAALDARPMLPPPVEPSLGSPAAAPAPSPAHPPAEPRGADPHPDVPQAPSDVASPASPIDTPAVDANEQWAPVAPAEVPPEPVAPAPTPEPPIIARPAPSPKAGRPAPAAERPQPRVGKAARSEGAAGARRQERADEPAAERESPSGADAAGLNEEGKPRSVRELIDMGDEFRDAGDTEWARRLYRAAQKRGSAKAAVAEAETYDPQYTAASSRPDADEARRLYSEAARQGDREAAKRLEELDQWMSERAGR